MGWGARAAPSLHQTCSAVKHVTSHQPPSTPGWALRQAFGGGGGAVAPSYLHGDPPAVHPFQLHIGNGTHPTDLLQANRCSLQGRDHGVRQPLLKLQHCRMLHKCTAAAAASCRVPCGGAISLPVGSSKDSLQPLMARLMYRVIQPAMGPLPSWDTASHYLLIQNRPCPALLLLHVCAADLCCLCGDSSSTLQTLMARPRTHPVIQAACPGGSAPGF